MADKPLDERKNNKSQDRGTATRPIGVGASNPSVKVGFC